MTTTTSTHTGIFITEAHKEVLEYHGDTLGRDFLLSLGLSTCEFPTGEFHIEQTEKMQQTAAVWHSYGGSAACLKPLLCRECYDAMDGDVPVGDRDGHEHCPGDDGECLTDQYFYDSAACIDDTCRLCRQ